MNTGWSPKPLRNVEQHFTELPVVVKGLTPMQRQRELDGTPHTRTPATALHPPDPVLSLPNTMVKKGSLVEKFDERPKAPKQDPEDPMTVVKSYLASKPAAVETTSKSVEKMNAAIQDVLAKTGAK